MHTSSIPDAKYQELNMSFEFEQNEDKLIITARVENTTYKTELMFNPDFEFEDVKDAFLNKHFKLVSRTNEILKLRVGFLNLQFKNVENQIFDQITETITELKNKLQNQVEKNKTLERSNQQLRADVDSLMTKVADLAQKFEHIQSLNGEQNLSVIKSKQKINENQMNKQNQPNQLNQMIERLAQVEKSNIEMKKLIDQQKEKISQYRIEFAMRKAQIHETKSEVNYHSVEIDQLKNIKEKEMFQISKIVKSIEDQKKLFAFFDDKKVQKVNLLYRASENEFLVSKFHEKCDNIPCTLVICETEFGKVIGGFTTFSWERSTKQHGHWLSTGSNLKEHFLFSLTNNDKFVISHYSKYCIHLRADDTWGPEFGGGADFSICNKANQQKNSSANIGHTYKHADYKYGDKDLSQRFSGCNYHNFKVKEWQVWQVEFRE